VLLASGRARPDQRAQLLSEIRPGSLCTIILAGFVPDATEALYVQRGMLLRHGSVYYVNYPRDGFSLPLLFAQLDDLLDELAAEGKTPALIGVSFGCGVLIEWMRHLRRLDLRVRTRGVVLISPVTCAGDIIDPGEERPSTLLGRALRPFMGVASAAPDASHIEKSRKLLMRMFESGAQNRRAIRTVMTAAELLRLRHRVMSTLGSIETAPTLAALGMRPEMLFPSVRVRTVVNRRGSPVQHASLLFHCFNYSSHLSSFYRTMREHVRIDQRHRRFRALRSWLGAPRFQLPGPKVA
jgi:hypothetical protein